MKKSGKLRIYAIISSVRIALHTTIPSLEATTGNKIRVHRSMPPAPFRMCEGNDYSLVPPMGFYWVKDGHYPGYKHDNLVMLSELAERVAAIEVSISNNLITMILKLVAVRDTNGNPRGVYVGLDSQLKILAAWDVGYHGKAIIPDEFKNKLTDIEIRTSGKDYNEIARGKMTGKCLSIALEPYDSFEGKSFNGKAGISTYDGSSFTLDSCEMSIMRFSKDRGFERMSLKWDKTIARHINSFRRSFGKLDKFTYEDFIALQMV